MATAEKYLNSPQWVHQVEAVFDLKDSSNSGSINRDDWLASTRKAEPSPGPLEKAQSEYLDALKFPESGTIDKKAFLELLAEFSAAESRRPPKETSTAKLALAWFDVLSSGAGSIDPSILANAAGLPVEGIFALKTIARDDFADKEVQFWLDPEDTSDDELYGPKFFLQK